MTNLLASGHQSLNIIRRDLEDLFIEFAVPRRMLREVERVFEQAPTPIWLWREMDHILEEFMAPPMLRRSIERVFDRVLTQRGFGMHGSSFGSPFIGSSHFGSPHFGTSSFGTSSFGTSSFGSPWRNSQFGSFHNMSPMMYGGGFGIQSSRGFGFEDFTPALELVEMQGEFLVRVDLPGVRETDVETRITEDNVLIIRGERRDFMGRNLIGFSPIVNTLGRPEYSEQHYGIFTRTVPLPRNINPTQIHAFFRDGVLEVRIPKFDSVGTFNTFNMRNQRRVPIGRDDSRVVFGSGFGNFGTGTWNTEQRPHVN